MVFASDMAEKRKIKMFKGLLEHEFVNDSFKKHTKISKKWVLSKFSYNKIGKMNLCC